MTHRPHETQSDRRSTEETDLFAGLRAESHAGDPESYPVVPDVQVTGLLGAGGMGVVYRGKQTYLDRDVAIKVLRDTSQNYTARFRREAKILATMSHPSIVACYAAGTTENEQCYLVMEFIDGPNLHEWLERRGPLSSVYALSVCRDLARALGYAHENHRIIHRDVKPENVLLKPRAGGGTDRKPPYDAKLADLGLARSETTDAAEGATLPEQLTRPGAVMGSPATMSPEQFDDPDAVDHRTDIYGLGCVLYAMLTGQKAFQGDTLSATILQKRSKLGPDQSKVAQTVPRELATLVQSMLAHDRMDRPQSYQEIAERCERIMERLLGARRAPKRKSRVPLVLVAMLLIAATAFGAWFFFLRTETLVRAVRAREGEALRLEATVPGEGGRWQARSVDGGPSFDGTLASGPVTTVTLPQARGPYALAFDFVNPTGEVTETVEVDVDAVDDPVRFDLTPRQTVEEGAEVVLEASDPDSPLPTGSTWELLKNEGPAFDLGAGGARVAFRVPRADTPFSFTVGFTGNGDPEHDALLFRVEAQDEPPSAVVRRASADEPKEGQRIELSAQESLASRDIDTSHGEIARYAWTIEAPDGLVLENADTELASFVAPHAAEPYPVRVRLTVADGAGQTDETEFEVTVQAQPDAPVARIEATDDGWIDGARVRVSAAPSHDRGDGEGTEHLEYAWTVSRGPEGLIPEGVRQLRDLDLTLPDGLPLRDRSVALQLEVSDGTMKTSTTWQALIRSHVGALTSREKIPVWGEDGRSRFDASRETEDWIYTGTCLQGIPPETARTEYPLYLPEGVFEFAGAFALLPLGSDRTIERRAGLRFEFGDGTGVQFELEPLDAQGRQHRVHWYAADRLVDGTWVTKEALPFAIQGGVTSIVTPLVTGDRDHPVQVQVGWEGDRLRFALEWTGRTGQREGGIAGTVRPPCAPGYWPWRLALYASGGILNACDVTLAGR